MTDLTVYAREKYHISEEFPWEDLPGFSVLSNPRTGRRIALLIRHWSWETGDMIQCCDLKCGDVAKRDHIPFLVRPFHMRGRKWVGIRMADERVDRETVFRLFDLALRADVPQPYTTVVLDDLNRGGSSNSFSKGSAEDFSEGSAENSSGVYHETRLPVGRTGFPPRPGTPLPGDHRRMISPFDMIENGGMEKEGRSKNHLPVSGSCGDKAGAYNTKVGDRSDKVDVQRPETNRPPVPRQENYPRKNGAEPSQNPDSYADVSKENPGASAFAGVKSKSESKSEFDYPEVPEKIQEMWSLYEYGYSSFYLKCRNFYRQGKFMESYEDNEPWKGDVRRFYPTYHDLNLRQLRGYFTWRTRLRKGKFEPVARSLAYIYVYELLSGIGTGSPEDSVRKMDEFEKGFLDAGFGDENMRRNFRRWRMEYCILHNVPVEKSRRYLSQEQLERDTMLEVLKYPDKYSDEEVYDTLREFDSKRLPLSPVIQKDPARGKHLFTLAWRQAVRIRPGNGRNVFAALFGTPITTEWRPLANAVHWEEPDPASEEKTFTYPLNLCRSYHCRRGKWTVECYEGYAIQPKTIRALLHEIDGLFRRALKTGRYLKANPGMAWAAPFVQAALAEEKKEEQQKRISGIAIDFSGLDRIRQDAAVTRDALLTPEETEIPEEPENPVTAEDSATAESPTRAEPPAVTESLVKSETPVTTETLEAPESPAATDTSAKAENPATTETSAMVETPVSTGGEVRTDQTAEQMTVPSGHVKAATANRAEENQTDTAGTENPAKEILLSASDTAAFYRKILEKLLRGEHPEKEIRATHQLPSIVTDAINEALYDEIGDSVLICEDDKVTLVEDYRQDVEEILQSGEDPF